MSAIPRVDSKIRKVNKDKNKLVTEPVSVGEILIYTSLALSFIIFILEFLRNYHANQYIRYALVTLYPVTFIIFITGIVYIVKAGSQL
jgi:hypothetical protein